MQSAAVAIGSFKPLLVEVGLRARRDLASEEILECFLAVADTRPYK